MSDRNNLIKFGPEWLRNLARERSAGRTINENPRPGANQSTRSTGSQGPGGLASQGSTGATGSSNTTGQTLTSNASRPGNTTQGTGVTSPCDSGASGGSIVPSTSSGITTRNSSTNQTPKILLAKQRYGREEMLALYDTNVEAPDELKYFDILYQPRGKPPAALNSFEEETSENIRGSAPIGATSPGERFGAGRGRGVTDTRARPRLPFLRVPPSPVPGGRGFSTMGSPRMAGFSGGDEEHGSARSWSASNGGAGQNRTSAERSDQTDWNKMFRRRQPNNTNWRQQTSREDDEWRHSSGSENPRNNRPNTDKWDRDWNERQGQDRPQGWNSNRRTWVANETQNNEDNLPEWAVDNAEAGAGTFDSSGAFHGFSNDDSNIPRTQESTYPLARSHTHGSFVRSKTVEEGSEEWWASEKAKKLSPKRFEAGDMKYKRSHSTGSSEQSPASNTNQNTNLNFVDLQDIPEKLESHPPNPEPSLSNIEDKKKKFSESKTFDAHMRSDINFSENSNEQSNFQSVIITPNNSLRQKHQNIVSPTGSETTNTGSSHGLQGMHASHKKEENSSTVSSDQILDGIIDLSMDDTNVRSSMLLEENTVPSSQGIITSLPNQSPSLMRITNPSLPTHGMSMNSNNLPSVLQGQGIQNVGLQNVAMNSSLGLPIGATNNGMVMQMQGLPPVIQNSQINSPIASGLHNLPVIGGFPPNNPLPVMQPQVNSLFLNQSNNPQISSASDIQMPNHVSQNNIFPMHGHGLQHSSSQVPFGSIYSNVMSSGQQPSNNLTDQWYYEDPKKVIQGPFSSKDMYEWFRAGFFNSSLMVRRACDTHMRPLGSYGPVVPFVQDVISPFPMSGFDSIPQSTHEVMNQQPALGIEDSLWSQPRQSQDLLWMQQAMNTRNETGVNNLPIFFWDPQPSSAISSNSLLPEDIAKEMKTEDQILAQLRASQNIPVSTTPFLNDNTTTTITNTPPSVSQKDESFTSVSGIKAPGLEELQKLMHNETLKSNAAPDLKDVESSEVKNEKVTKAEPLQTGTNIKLAQNKISSEKSTKQVKSESDKAVKNKDNNTTKAKNKKAKEEGKAKEEIESKSKEEDSLKTEKRSAETSPTKSRKDEKPNKKEIEKEKKEWIKEGFTIVKGPEKSVYKESKKKADEVKAIEEAERKRKEEEKAAVEEEKKKRVAESKKPQEQQKQNLTESLMKKAPWSAVATQAVTTNKDGLTLAEIQRLEREKKLEQIKEQQHMMQIIAQQQAVALAREQEMQAGLGWAKKKSANNTTGQSLAEIQAEAKRQSAAAAAAAAAAQAIEDAQAMAVTQQPQTNHVPWGSSQNGGGFWETQSSPSPMPEKPQESVKTEPSKSKKKMNINVTAKKETLPTVEFESWCTTVLASWSSKIDVPTFIGFLRDIESPYEVKDYVKCYLGESKDSNDFARQFLERRSKLLRVGMVTPSDDLCSPAMAINPRSTSVSDSQEGKSKKTKKNKMLKVDARILGFSVTASEDRINVGDIDTV